MLRTKQPRHAAILASKKDVTRKATNTIATTSMIIVGNNHERTARSVEKP